MRERADLLGGSSRPAALDGRYRVAAGSPAGRMTDPVRVLIADDDDLMRAGLRGVLSSDEAIDMVGEAATAATPSTAPACSIPEVVLMDVRMPDLDGIAATRELLAALARRPGSLSSRRSSRTTTSSARCAPARPASCSSAAGPGPDRAIHTVAAGDALLSPVGHPPCDRRMAASPRPTWTRRAARRAHPARARGARADRPRPVQRRDRRGARVEESTVKTPCETVLAKLGARDRVQAVIFAYESGPRRPRP